MIIVELMRVEVEMAISATVLQKKNEQMKLLFVVKHS
jgi:hypothetical protein